MKKIIVLMGLIVLIGAGCNNNATPKSSITTPINTIPTTTQTNTTTISTNTVKQTTMTSTAKNSSTTKKEATKTEKKDVDLLQQYDQAVLKTSMGNITIQFYNSDSPKTVKNFLTLAEKGFYDKTSFHRVINDFMIQGGDPLSKNDNRLAHGTGGPGYKFDDEFNTHKLIKGSMAMANSGPNTNGSQFFIVTRSATDWLDGKHTNFGYVISGMDIVEKIEDVRVDSRDNPLESVTINSIVLQHSK